MLRVGRCVYDRKGKRTDPSWEGFTTIVVMTKGIGKWGDIGPYELRDDKGRIMENIWQFSKAYARVPATCQKKSRHDATVVWQHPAEQHLVDPARPLDLGNLSPEYWAWRQKGFSCPYAVRYPVGFQGRHECLGSFVDSPSGEVCGPFGYVESRKELYVPLYCRLVKVTPGFRELKRRLLAGEKLLIAEVDGPHEESAAYYAAKYGTPLDWIERNSVAISEDSLRIMLNDPKHPFGHGYCLAAALLDLDALLGAEPMPKDADEPDASSPPLTNEDLASLLMEADWA